MTKKLTVDGIEYLLNTQKTLLENLEAHALESEFHCRDGHCGACKCRLISGTVKYKEQPMAYLREGEILPCSCISKEDVQLSSY